MDKARFLAINPVLPVRDVGVSIRYYTDKLGFQLRFQDDPANPKYAVVGRDDIRVHVQWHDEADFGGEGPELRFVIDDPDRLYEEYKDKGVFHDRTTLKDTPWGTREFAFFDLDGNGLFFYRDL